MQRRVYKNNFDIQCTLIIRAEAGGGGENEHLNKFASSLSVKKCLSGTIPHSLTANNT